MKCREFQNVVIEPNLGPILTFLSEFVLRFALVIYLKKTSFVISLFQITVFRNAVSLLLFCTTFFVVMYSDVKNVSNKINSVPAGVQNGSNPQVYPRSCSLREKNRKSKQISEVLEAGFY